MKRILIFERKYLNQTNNINFSRMVHDTVDCSELAQLYRKTIVSIDNVFNKSEDFQRILDKELIDLEQNEIDTSKINSQLTSLRKVIKDGIPEYEQKSFAVQSINLEKFNLGIKLRNSNVEENALILIEANNEVELVKKIYFDVIIQSMGTMDIDCNFIGANRKNTSR